MLFPNYKLWPFHSMSRYGACSDSVLRMYRQINLSHFMRLLQQSVIQKRKELVEITFLHSDFHNIKFGGNQSNLCITTMQELLPIYTYMIQSMKIIRMRASMSSARMITNYLINFLFFLHIG